MTLNEIQSELSHAYVHAVASRAGCAVSRADRSTDNMGIDLHITATREPSPENRRTLLVFEVQLKSTTNPRWLNNPSDTLAFTGLTKRHYNIFRESDYGVFRLVILLCLPHDPAQWLTTTPENLILRECAYWVDLHGQRESDAEHPTIHFPRQNVFNVEQLQGTILNTFWNRGVHK
jgi:hypothetical protein